MSYSNYNPDNPLIMRIMVQTIILILAAQLCFNTSILAQSSHDEENKLLDYCNYLRTNPKKFLQEVVKPYLYRNGYDSVNNRYVSSLIKDLKHLRPGPALEWHSYLHNQAHEFAADMGKTGATGHYSRKLGSFEKRLKGFKNEYIGENCSYGHDGALDILMQLLIDEDVPSLGHRKNLLDPIFRNVGMGIEPHAQYEWNCVMDFGGAHGGKTKKRGKKSFFDSLFASLRR